jgi:hypothetical protein
MLRFVLKTKVKDRWNGGEFERLSTLDIDCPELEEKLGGGVDQGGYEITELVGVETLPNTDNK